MTISPLTSVTPLATTAASGAGSTTSTGNTASQLSNPQMFLKLLVAELQNQDPTNPTSPSTILQQTSELAQMESVTKQTTAITAAQTIAQDTEATGLVGKTVTATIAGNKVSGPVTDVTLSSSGAPTLTVNGTAVPLADVTDVSS